MTENSERLTPKEAAALARVSRSTINNALRDKTLPGQQDNRGRWKIRRSDVLAWADRHHPDRQGIVSDKTQANRRQITDMPEALIEERAELRATVKGLEAQLEAVKEDRDRWLEALQRAEEERRDLLDRLTEASKPRGWLGNLLRR